MRSAVHGDRRLTEASAAAETYGAAVGNEFCEGHGGERRRSWGKVTLGVGCVNTGDALTTNHQFMAAW